MHDCEDIFYQAVVAQVVPICRPKASSCRAAHSRQPIQIDAVHVLPVVKRTICVDQAHSACQRLNFEREGQGREALANAVELVAVEIIEPFAAVQKVLNFRERLAKGAAPGHQIVIAADGMEPGFVEPSEHFVRFRASVNQVAN